MKADCTQFDDLMRESIGSTLAPAEEAALDAHAQVCPACVARMKGYIAARELAREVREGDDEAFAPLPETVVARILAAQRAAAAAEGAMKSGRGKRSGKAG